MIFPNKSLRSAACLIALLTFSLPQNTRATSFTLSDFNGTVSLSVGTQVTTVNELMFGFFAPSFTPSVVNFNQWLSNFTGVSGYFNGTGPELSASIDIGGNTVYPVGQQLSVIVYNILNSNEANKASATEAAIFTNPRWVISSALSTDLTTYYFDLTGSHQGYDNLGAEINRATGTTSALVGIFSGSSATMAVIPEPSSMSLLIMGLASALAFRRKRG